jgi:hypothetical protein
MNSIRTLEVDVVENFMKSTNLTISGFNRVWGDGPQRLFNSFVFAKAKENKNLKKYTEEVFEKINTINSVYIDFSYKNSYLDFLFACFQNESYILISGKDTDTNFSSKEKDYSILIGVVKEVPYFFNDKTTKYEIVNENEESEEIKTKKIIEGQICYDNVSYQFFGDYLIVGLYTNVLIYKKCSSIKEILEKETTNNTKYS